MTAQDTEHSWKRSFEVYTQRPVITMLFLGFSAGLPLFLVFGTLSIWLREAGIERATIGFFSWAALPYGFKFLWAPLIDHVPLPGLKRLLGRRRSWLLVSQISVAIFIAAMAFTDASLNPAHMAIFAALLAFSSATQDIVIDAYRIEAADIDMQAAMTSTYQLGYRLALILAGAGALEIAGAIDVIEGYSYHAWRVAYLVMACAMGLGVLTTLFAAEPKVPDGHANLSGPGLSFDPAKIGLWLKEAILDPFIDFFTRFGWIALVILALISIYRLTDVVMGIMAGPFYIDLGFEKQEIGRISKFFGIWMTIAGALIGGVLAMRFGTIRILFVGAFLAAATNLLFAFMATQEPNIWMLAIVISADNLGAGIAGTAFIAYLSGLTNTAYTATQYALFSSIMLLFPKFLAGFSGLIVDAVGYVWFFCLTAAMGIPAMILILVLARLNITGGAKPETEAEPAPAPGQ